ncbi:hypothetical protein Ciccas_005144 [Cichlidogyrus casuarinus]|uniref:Uncharacterized protein n=1 Tax=Cichlidogyrus casuarinus TaxID=1844966 RepID=A0ABD2Q9H8_9PLAT
MLKKHLPSGIMVRISTREAALDLVQSTRNGSTQDIHPLVLTVVIKEKETENAEENIQAHRKIATNQANRN